ncbi:MAG: ABC transporter substrate-binding protein [Propionibacteriaceae bacterium]|jgi:peptide/nickel transport system substrate-binding protein|nr:ABC transporter substrate-binding protein [Propionibacteriaceae bacterium]
MDTRHFVVATPIDAVEFNDCFRNYTGSAGYLVCNNIYNRVVLNEWYNPTVFPDLATHWETLDGATRFRFHLNQAARWHDGAPVTSHDVAHSHGEAIAQGYEAGRFLGSVAEIREVNRHTVDYVLKEPNAGFLTQLGNFIFTHILPAHLYEGTDWATNPHNLDPVGSGPFRFVDWIPGDRIELEAVRDHWGPRPEIDRITIRIVPDRDECVAMVCRGEAHCVPQDTLTFDRLSLIEGAEDTVWLDRKPGPGMALLDFNHAKAPWNDVRARRAVGAAVDRSRFGLLADPGAAEPWDHYWIGTVDWAFNPDAKAPAHDVDLATRLLDEVGLVEDAGGVRLRTKVSFMEMFHAHRILAREVCAALKEVGIEAEPTGLSSVDWKNTFGDPDSDFDLFIVGGGMSPDPEVTANKYTSKGGPANLGRHHNQAVDRLYQAGRTTVPRAQRGAIYRELQATWARDVEWVPLFWYGTYYPMSRRFFGWSDQLDFSVPWWHWGRIRPVEPDFYD